MQVIQGDGDVLCHTVHFEHLCTTQHYHVSSRGARFLLMRAQTVHVGTGSWASGDGRRWAAGDGGGHLRPGLIRGLS